MVTKATRLEHCSLFNCRKAILPTEGMFLFNSVRHCLDCGAVELAKTFHATYERLAPNFAYETRKESAKPWEQVPEHNRKLMIATCKEILVKEAMI